MSRTHNSREAARRSDCFAGRFARSREWKRDRATLRHRLKVPGPVVLLSKAARGRVRAIHGKKLLSRSAEEKKRTTHVEVNVLRATHVHFRTQITLDGDAALDASGSFGGVAKGVRVVLVIVWLRGRQADTICRPGSSRASQQMFSLRRNSTHLGSRWRGGKRGNLRRRSRRL